MADHIARTKKPHTTIFCFRHGGTHLIKPLVKKLVKLPTVDPDKLPNGTAHIPLGPVVIAFRDPRNIMVAAIKWDLRRRDLSIEPSFAHDEAIARRIRDEMPRMTGLAEHWKTQQGMLIRFEDLVGPIGPEYADELGVRLGAPPPAGREALAAVLGTGHTFTGRYSSFREWFGPAADEAWSKQGGDYLAALMGYGE